jgi:hypothetical protein
MSVKDEVERILTTGARIEEGATLEPEADIANLRAAVRELQQVVMLLAEELDKRDADSAA